MLIAVDGIDGAGKTTFCARLGDMIRESYQLMDGQVVISSDLGFSDFAKRVRDILVGERISAMSQLHLILAARNQHLQDVVKPALELGKIVILDRYLHSTYAYQHRAEGVPFDAVARAHAEICVRSPDLQFLLVLPLEIAIQRVSTRGGRDAFESRPKQYQEIICNYFNSQPDLKADKHNFVQQKINAACPQEEMLEQARPFVSALLSRKFH